MTEIHVEVYKDILIKIEIIELPRTLKFEGLTNPGPINTVCTFRVKPGEVLVGGEDGPSHRMDLANEYLNSVWMPRNRDLVYNYCFKEGNHNVLARVELQKQQAGLYATLALVLWEW